MVFQTRGESRLYIKLAERLIDLDPGPESYFNRPPFIEALQLSDANDQPLDFEATTSAECLQFHTSIGNFHLVFQDPYTLAFGLPADRMCGLRFHIRKEYCLPSETGAELKTIRKLGYATNSRMVKKWTSAGGDGIDVHLLVQSWEDCAITIQISPEGDLNQRVPPFSSMRRQADIRWKSWFNKIPPVAKRFQEKYAYAWWVMANNLVSPHGFITHEAMMPTKAYYVGLWLWDNALHAVALRHVDIELARDQLRVMLTRQLANGMLPDAIFDEGVVTELKHPFPSAVTKPPILAWAALKLHESYPDLSFLHEIYEPLVRCTNWWLEGGDNNIPGLAQYSHPYSSGLDNNPLWDDGMPVVSPDIDTYLSIQMSCLAVMARLLGMENEAEQWVERSEQVVKKMIEVLWDDDPGVFQALHNGRPVPVLTPFNLYPLWTGRLPEHITQRLLEHLRNPGEFWSEYPLPTVARNDPSYDPEAMWRGPVWANINYFFVEALHKIGGHILARELRDKTLEIISENPGMYEYYSSETGKPPPAAAPMFGWTSAVFIELAIQTTLELATTDGLPSIIQPAGE